MKRISSSILILACAFMMAACGGKRGRDASDLNLGGDVRPVCGSRQILGTNEESFRNGACGISNPVRVHAVNGVKLSQPALINCNTASTLSDWVGNSLFPAARRIGKTPQEMNIMASYSCRTRNHRPGAKLSEHSYGNAIDIGGIRFTDGSYFGVLEDYYANGAADFFLALRRGACGPFGTVLGPGSDALHRNHFHFDVARYSMGAYCR